MLNSNGHKINHAQKCKTVKNCCHFNIDFDDLSITIPLIKLF